MLRDYWEPSLSTAAIGLLSIASGSDTFVSLQTEFDGLPNGLIVALGIAAALRISFFLFADGVVRQDLSWWARFAYVFGILFVVSASAASGALPGSMLSPIERITLDAVILGLIAFKNASQPIYTPVDDGWNFGSRALPADERTSASNALELIDLLDRYAVEEYGGMFLYVPKPEPKGLPRLQPWILLLQARNVIKNEPWVVFPNGVRDKVLENYPQLLTGSPGRFYIYRMDREALAKLMVSL